MNGLSQGKVVAACAFLVALAGAVIFVFRGEQPEGPPELSAFVDSPRAEAPIRGADGSTATRTPPADLPPNAGSRGFPEGAEAASLAEEPELGTPAATFDPSVLYEPAPLKAGETFDVPEMETTGSGPCLPNGKQGEPFSLPRHLMGKGLTGKYKYPGEAHLVDWNQYFKAAGTYAQLSVEWNLDSPPTYVVRALQGTTTQLNEKRPLPGYEGRALPLAEAMDLARKVERLWTAEGAMAGARTMVLSEGAFAGANGERAPSRVEFVNGELKSYDDASLRCRNRESVIACSCPAE